jgi:hypothetical protein
MSLGPSFTMIKSCLVYREWLLHYKARATWILQATCLSSSPSLPSGGALLPTSIRKSHREGCLPHPTQTQGRSRARPVICTASLSSRYVHSQECSLSSPKVSHCVLHLLQITAACSVTQSPCPLQVAASASPISVRLACLVYQKTLCWEKSI